MGVVPFVRRYSFTNVPELKVGHGVPFKILILAILKLCCSGFVTCHSGGAAHIKLNLYSDNRPVAKNCVFARVAFART